MTSSATTIKNLIDDSFRYSSVLYEISQNKALTANDKTLVAALYSVTFKQGTYCHRKYKQLTDTFGISTATLTRSFKRLNQIKTGFIKKLGQSTYTTAAPTSKKFFPLYSPLLKAEFKIGKKVRRLTKNEALGAALLIYLADKDSPTRYYVKISYKELADVLGRSERTAYNIIVTLKKAEIIFKANSKSRHNAHYKSTYYINKAIVDTIHSAMVKIKTLSAAKKRAEREAARQIDEEEQELAAREQELAARQRQEYYSEVREQQQKKLEEQDNKLRQITEYKEWHDNYPKRLQDIYNLNISEEEKDKRIDELDLLGESILRRYGGEPTPKFRCEKCHDTGQLPDGTPCNCYPVHPRRTY